MTSFSELTKNDREHLAHREPTGRAGEVAMAVVGPDGGSIGGTGGTSMLDDAAFTPGGSSLTPAGYLADDVATDPVDEGDIGVARMNPNTRIIYVQLKDSAGADVAVGGGTQYDEDSAAANAEKLTMAGVVRKDTAATLVTADGDRTELIVDANGRLHVNASGAAVPVTDNGGSLSVDDGGGSLTVDGSVSLAAAVPAGTNNIGDVDVVTQIGAGNLAVGQVSVTTSSTQIANTRATRRAITIVNLGTTDVYLGLSAAAATASGVLLLGVKGAAVTIPTTVRVDGIVASGSQSVSYFEVYD